MQGTGRFIGSPRPLQAVAVLVPQLRDGARAHWMAALSQLLGQGPRNLERPAQRRLGVATRPWLQQRLQIRPERGIDLCQNLATRTRAANSPAARGQLRRVLLQLGELPDPYRNPLASDTGRRRHRRGSPRPNAFASYAAHNRIPRSSSTGANAPCFRRISSIRPARFPSVKQQTTPLISIMFP